MNFVCNLDPGDVPEEGTNENGVPWSEIREEWEKMCGVSRDNGVVNMTPDELRSWSEHECANTHSVDPQQVRDRVLKATTTPLEEWESEGSWRDDNPEEMGHLEISKKVNSFNARGYGSWAATDDNYKDVDGIECPNGWGVAALNWQMDPDRTYEDYY